MDRRLVLLAPGDNCVVVTQQVESGERVDIDGALVTVAISVGIGHKLARTAIAASVKVVKYGATIGHASTAIAAGEHIHTHNLESDYTKTHTLAAGRESVRESA